MLCIFSKPTIQQTHWFHSAVGDNMESFSSVFLIYFSKILYTGFSVPFQEQHSKACGENLHKIVRFYHHADSPWQPALYPSFKCHWEKVYTFVLLHNAGHHFLWSIPLGMIVWFKKKESTMKKTIWRRWFSKGGGWTEVVWIRINSGYGVMQVDLNNRTVCWNI